MFDAEHLRKYKPEHYLTMFLRESLWDLAVHEKLEIVLQFVPYILSADPQKFLRLLGVRNCYYTLDQVKMIHEYLRICPPALQVNIGFLINEPEKHMRLAMQGCWTRLRLLKEGYQC